MNSTTTRSTSLQRGEPIQAADTIVTDFLLRVRASLPGLTRAQRAELRAMLAGLVLELDRRASEERQRLIVEATQSLDVLGMEPSGSLELLDDEQLQALTGSITRLVTNRQAQARVEEE